MFRKLCLLFLVCTACKKDPVKPVPKLLNGTWQGRYGNISSPEPGDTAFGPLTAVYTIDFKDNGTMTVYDGRKEDAALMAEGVYSLQNGKLFGEYTYVRGSSSTFSIQAILHKPDSLAGTWRIGSWGPTGGKFFLKK
ncbi:hypothetical protein [Chitinophaga niabensis]|uniref:Lipocalin-like domain-containing protein n=1 Tax=Chitinophaga niabensis TaxID=536979 RepID=A0A1N6DNR9_9BACT|nr:hypothetical protein [Chitinophaga niabensis]SIN72367.1 hypothetical protein SAMN04488055_0948 [Chitinophaga niabensis]